VVSLVLVCGRQSSRRCSPRTQARWLKFCVRLPGNILDMGFSPAEGVEEEDSLHPSHIRLCCTIAGENPQYGVFSCRRSRRRRFTSSQPHQAVQMMTPAEGDTATVQISILWSCPLWKALVSVAGEAEGDAAQERRQGGPAGLDCCSRRQKQRQVPLFLALCESSVPSASVPSASVSSATTQS